MTVTFEIGLADIADNVTRRLQNTCGPQDRVGRHTGWIPAPEAESAEVVRTDGLPRTPRMAGKPASNFKCLGAIIGGTQEDDRHIVGNMTYWRLAGGREASHALDRLAAR